MSPIVRSAVQIRWRIDRRCYGGRDGARSLDVDCVSNERAGVDELGAVHDRADGEPSFRDSTLLDVQRACGGSKREVAMPDGELFERTALAGLHAGPAGRDDELVRIESRREMRHEELGCRNRSA